MKASTRDRLLEQAEILFAEKGFYGASINDIARELSISKQGLLHHFSTKEKLYAAVLHGAAEYLIKRLEDGQDESLSPHELLLGMVSQFSTTSERTNRVIVLLMRELLDNRERAETAQQWFLRPVLDKLEGAVIEAQREGHFAEVHPLAFVYQILGALQYFAISQPTLKRIYSKERFEEHRQHHLLEIKRLISAAL